jgi:hypothetical protein
VRLLVEPLGSAGLLRSHSAAAVLRRRLIVASCAAVGVTVLILVAFAQLADPVGDPSTFAFDEHQSVHGLAPIIAQPQNRVGTSIAVALLSIPLVAIVVQALHVGQLARDRLQSRLSLAGATPHEVRRHSATETAIAFACGGLISGPVYLLLWLALGIVPPAGSRLIPTPDLPQALAWLVLILLMAACGAAVGAKSRRGHAVGPLGTTVTSPPRVHPLWGATAGCAALLILVEFPDFPFGLGDDFLPVAIIVETLLVLFALATLVTAFVSRAKPNPRRADQAVEVLAAAQRRGHPGGAGWVAAVTFVCGVSLHIEGTYLVYFLTATDLTVGVMFYAGPTLLAIAAVLLAVCVGLATLGLAITDHLLTARRAVASTAALGIEPARLVAVQARVLAAVTVPAVLIGYLAPCLVYIVIGPSPTLVLILITAPLLGGAVNGLCHLMANLFAKRIHAATDPTHLRTT